MQKCSQYNLDLRGDLLLRDAFSRLIRSLDRLGERDLLGLSLLLSLERRLESFGDLSLRDRRSFDRFLTRSLLLDRLCSLLRSSLLSDCLSSK